MVPRRSAGLLALALALVLMSSASTAVEVTGLAGHDDIFGRYAPGGDCAKLPRVGVDASGLSFEVGGKTEKVAVLEYAASWGPQGYEGIEKAIFPFTRPDGEYAILLLFNAGEVPGALTISGHGEGYPGGPPFHPRNQALAEASPYARCK